MSLSDKEFVNWNSIVAGFNDTAELDPIEQAARDTRVVRTAQYLLTDVEPAPDQDIKYGKLLIQVGYEYMLDVDEVGVAIVIAEDRITRERKG